jgi:hypothetical protein
MTAKTSPTALRDLLASSANSTSATKDDRFQRPRAYRTREHFMRVETWLKLVKGKRGKYLIGGRMYWVLESLSKYFNAEGHAYMSHDTLAEDSGVSLTTVKSALKFAQEHGFLEVRSHHNAIGRQLTNDYYMLDPRPPKTAKPKAQKPTQGEQPPDPQEPLGCQPPPNLQGGGVKINPVGDDLRGGFEGGGEGSKLGPKDSGVLVTQETSFQQQHRAAGERRGSKRRPNDDAPKYAPGPQAKAPKVKASKPKPHKREVIEPTPEAKRLLRCWELLGIPGARPSVGVLNGYQPKELRTAMAWLLLRIRNGVVRYPAKLLTCLLERVREGEHRQAYYTYADLESIQRGIAHPSRLGRFTRDEQPPASPSPELQSPPSSKLSPEPQAPSEPVAAEPSKPPRPDPGPMPMPLEDALTPLIEQGAAAQDEALRCCARYVCSRWTPQKHAVELLRRLMDRWGTFPAYANNNPGTQAAHATHLLEALYRIF